MALGRFESFSKIKSMAADAALSVGIACPHLLPLVFVLVCGLPPALRVDRMLSQMKHLF